MDPATVRDGGMGDLQDGLGLPQVAGLAIIIRGFQRQFVPVDAETSTSSIAELMAFRCMPGEDIDATLGRFTAL